MALPARSYLVYVDDSGNEDVGTLWTALALPHDLWAEYLRRWLSFRQTIYQQHGVPASFELHAQVWLSAQPLNQTKQGQLALIRRDDGSFPEVVLRGKAQRRDRFKTFEKGIRTVGTFTDARLFSTFTPSNSGPDKQALYVDLLCFIEGYLASERAHGTLIVDGTEDSGAHLRAAHRALLIKRRRVLEDAALRSSADSQLVQMADFCAYAAFQSIADNEKLDPKFRRQYETRLARLIVRPFGTDEGRCVRGFDYEGDQTDCPMED
jgi:hypothetical protein